MSGFYIVTPSGGDDTSAIQTAINSGQAVFLTEGTYHVSSPLTLPNKGQLIFGHSRDQTIVQAMSTFTGNGIFIMTSGEEGSELRDMKITCLNPGKTTGILVSQGARFDLARLRITLCSIGIDTRSVANAATNNGGATMDDLELWNTQVDIWIDGAEDSMIISNSRVWNFDDPSSTYRNHIAINCGRCDDLHVVNCMFICKTQLNFYDGVIPGFEGPRSASYAGVTSTPSMALR